MSYRNKRKKPANSKRRDNQKTSVFKGFLWLAYLFFASAILYVMVDDIKEQPFWKAAYNVVSIVIFITIPFWAKWIWRLLKSVPARISSRKKKSEPSDRNKESQVLTEVCSGEEQHYVTGYEGQEISDVKDVVEFVPTNISDYDELLMNAADVVFETGQASVSMLQRRLKLGYSRAARLIDQLEEAGIIGPYEGERPRKILKTQSQWKNSRQVYENELLKVSSRSKYEDLVSQAIKDEENWRREQRGLSPVEEELYQIDHMEGHAFEAWCANLLLRSGFSKATVTPGSNDQGVDVLAEKDGIKYAVQCKCYSSDLGNTPVQEVNTGKMIYHCHVGVVMTNRYFTQGAMDAAEATGTLLWDRDIITEMLKAL